MSLKYFTVQVYKHIHMEFLETISKMQRGLGGMWFYLGEHNSPHAAT